MPTAREGVKYRTHHITVRVKRAEGPRAESRENLVEKQSRITPLRQSDAYLSKQGGALTPTARRRK